MARCDYGHAPIGYTRPPLITHPGEAACWSFCWFTTGKPGNITSRSLADEARDSWRNSKWHCNLAAWPPTGLPSQQGVLSSCGQYTHLPVCSVCCLLPCSLVCAALFALPLVLVTGISHKPQQPHGRPKENRCQIQKKWWFVCQKNNQLFVCGRGLSVAR